MDKLYYSKFNFFVKINQTISNFYIYHKYMTYHIYYSIFLKKLYLYFYLLYPSCCNIIIIDKNYTFLNVFIKQDFIEIYSKTQSIAPDYNNII